MVVEDCRVRATILFVLPDNVDKVEELGKQLVGFIHRATDLPSEHYPANYRLMTKDEAMAYVNNVKFPTSFHVLVSIVENMAEDKVIFSLGPIYHHLIIECKSLLDFVNSSTNVLAMSIKLKEYYVNPMYRGSIC